MVIKKYKTKYFSLQKLFICGVFTFLISLELQGQAISKEELNYLEDLYRVLHENPELSFEEVQTSKRMANELRNIGFTVTEKVGKWGVVGVYENGKGPTVLIRADMDALPVKETTGLPYSSKRLSQLPNGDSTPAMHACGHDLHMAVWVGTARRLIELKETWSGTLLFVAQPAEEIGKGARSMLADGLFQRFPIPDFALALHANHFLKAGSIGYTKGYSMANVDMVNITVFGEGGHGAAPQTTIDPVVLTAKIVLTLQTIVSRELSPMEPAVLTIGAINGGTKGNVIPSEVQLKLTLRSYNPSVRNAMIEKIERICKYEALAAGVPESRLPQVDVLDEKATSLFNNEELSEQALVGIRKVLDPQQVIRVPAVMIGEDFSEYGQTVEQVPLFLFWLGTISEKRITAYQEEKKALPTLHSGNYYPDLHPTLETGVKAMSGATIELLNKRDK